VCACACACACVGDLLLLFLCHTPAVALPTSIPPPPMGLFNRSSIQFLPPLFSLYLDARWSGRLRSPGVVLKRPVLVMNLNRCFIAFRCVRRVARERDPQLRV
jgi:hypothetical protein